jgi:hypothetical protein
MNKQKIRNRWTEENINYLKLAYLQGLPLKLIASKLNRSVSAINKVLARRNLRTHSKMAHLPSLPRPTSDQIQKKRDLGAKIRKKNARIVKFLRSDYRQWVLFERVLYWLKTQKITVIKSEMETYYEVDGYPKSKLQILFIANLRREEQKLPVFYVKGVTRL